MSEDSGKRGGQDRKRINVHHDYDLRNWSRKFGVSKQDLKDAVRAVGNDAADVERHLNGKKQSL